LIYQSTGNTNYLNMAQTINTWQKANNYDATTGKVYESNTSTNTCYTYDSGTFAGSCWYLGDINTAMKCGDWVKTNWGVQMQHFGTGADAGGFNGICMRWLGKVGYDPAFCAQSATVPGLIKIRPGWLVTTGMRRLRTRTPCMAGIAAA
jgi:hypothetical protein